MSGPRGALHLKVAYALERRGGNRLTEIVESLAYHYASTQRADKAFTYLAMAGHKSLDVYSIAEAEQYYRQALAIFETDATCADRTAVAQAIVRLLETLAHKADHGEVGNIARKFMPFVKEAGETPALVIACYYQAMSLFYILDLRAAHDLSVEALAIAERINDGRTRAYARGGVLLTGVLLGLNSLQAADHMKEKLLEDVSRFGDSLITNFGLFFVAWDYLCRGLNKEAREAALRLIASGEQRSDPRAIGLAHWALGWINILNDDPEAAIVHAENCLRLSSFLLVDQRVSIGIRCDG